MNDDPVRASAGHLGDTIFLHDLRVETVVGIWEWERRIRQQVSIDLEIGADIRRAAAADRIEATLNYKAVAKRVQQFVGESSFQLVETLAQKIAELVLDEFDVPWICVRVSKPGAIRGARDVGVVIRRERDAC
jgi:dihydroneopterin aldolase